MGRIRLVETEQKSHLTKVEREKKRRETELAEGDASKMKRVPRDLLNDLVAVKKWKYVVEVKTANKTLDNTDFDNLVVYCNAWSDYVKALEVQRRAGSDPEGMLVAQRLIKQSTDIIYRFGSRLGLDLNSRLKTAAAKVEKEQASIDNRFGVI